MFTSRTIIINSAGIGSRLGMNTPKTLLNFKGKPVIYWILKALKKEKNIRIVIGYKGNEIIRYVSKLRKDITYVNNKNYFKTGTSSSFLLGCKHLNTEEVISIDGDLIFNKDQIQKILNSKFPCIGVTNPNTDNIIYVKKVKVSKKYYFNGFTKNKTDYEWSGIFKIKLKKLNLKDKSFHIFEMLKKINCKFIISEIKSMDFDTPQDYENLKKNFSKIYF
tara:strand:+ start:963 stop:1622 length:660 start_codon:yes stop_codon:yes gene_type:complete